MASWFRRKKPEDEAARRMSAEDLAAAFPDSPAPASAPAPEAVPAAAEPPRAEPLAPASAATPEATREAPAATTTIGKLAKKLQLEGKKVMLAAGDTFRAAMPPRSPSTRCRPPRRAASTC